MMMMAVWRLLYLCWMLLTSSTMGADNKNKNNNNGFLQMFAAQQNAPDPCYEEISTGAASATSGGVWRPRRCVPDFVNAAFGKSVAASSSTLNNAAQHLTDLHNVNNVTCWRSERQTLTASGNNVTLTLSLAKKYELTYISLQFCGRKPDTMAIYKSMDFGKNWQPLQYYSSQCRKLYGRPNRAVITRANEQEALCSDAHSTQQAASLGAGSRIAFSTMEARPSAFDFEYSPVLQDWVTATDVRVVFHRFTGEWNRLGGGDVNDVPAAAVGGGGVGGGAGGGAGGGVNGTRLQEPVQDFYSVADFAVGGRCKCNGHASRSIFNSFDLI